MGLRGFITSRISAAVVGIRQLRCAANARLRIAYAANIQGAILAVLSVNAAFGAGAAGAAGGTVCFVQIAAVGADCLGAVFAVGAINSITILAANAAFIQLTTTGALSLGAIFLMVLCCRAVFISCAGRLFLCLTFFTHKSAGTCFHRCHKAAVIRRADMGAVFFYCNAAVILCACVVTAPAFRHCLPIGAAAVGMIARCSFHSFLRLAALTVGQGSGAVTSLAFRCH